MHFSRLRTRLGVLYASLFAAALVVIAAAVQYSLVQNAEASIRDELTASGTVFDRIWTLRSNQLQEAAGLLARDFGFRAAVATRDAATIGSALDNLKRRLGIRTAFIVDVDGNVTGLSDPRQDADAAKLWTALDAGATGGVMTIGGMPYQAVAAPILMPTLGGWVVFASELDRAEMTRLENLAAIPLTATVLRKSGTGRWSGVIRDVDRAAIGTFVERARSSKRPEELRTSEGDAIALVKALPSFEGGAATVLLLRYPTALALAAYRPLQITILLTGLAGLVLMILGSLRLAETITRPISLLDDAARQLERGDAVRVEVTTRDEIGRLSESFNRMAQGIADRERRIAHLAFHDPLTGLPNRVLFREQLDNLLRRRGAEVAVLSLNLDAFALVNDTLGHPVGDALLKAVAERLNEVAGDDLVAGFGGDDFAVLVEIDNDRERAERLAGQLIKALQQPLLAAAGQDITVGASIGIAMAPGDGGDADTLIKNAGLALARAKADGRGSVSFFETGMDARAQARRTIEFDLRHALERRELELHFQPLYDIRRNRITGFESLIRWRHPRGGLVSPLDFIPVAEETGLIVPIGEWIFREACRQAMTWPDGIRVAVNVSPVQFGHPDLEAHVLNALDASGLDPERLEVEITESIFLDSSESTLDILHRLRGLGVRTSLDDFGTGYSSLSYLLSYPFDKIKIDQSFVRQLLTRPGSTAIVKAIVSLAEALDMETIAEGVEDEAQLDELRHQHVGQIQGYLISRPIPAADVAALIERAASGALVS